MTNKHENKTRSTTDTGIERKGVHGRSGITGITNASKDGVLLEKKTTRVGLHDKEREAGQKSTGALNWQMGELWNAGLASVPQRKLEKREHLWASELYSAPIDIWLKMHAVEYSNVPNERSLMKFESAHMVEWILYTILLRAGALQGVEERVEYQLEGMLKVTGRMDFLAGGNPNYKEAEESLRAMKLPEGFILGAQRVVEGLNKKYPKGLGEKPIELKSISSFGMDAMERNKKPIKRHRVQLYHYLMAKNYPVGLLVYICRDDSRMIDFNIFRDSYVKGEYVERIKLLTENFKKDTPPPIEELLIWDDDFHKFSKNFNVEYSNYLNKLYGYEKPRDYSEVWGRKAIRWNNLIKRIAKGASMTTTGKEVLKEMEDMGYNAEEMAKQYVNENDV